MKINLNIRIPDINAECLVGVRFVSVYIIQVISIKLANGSHTSQVVISSTPKEISKKHTSLY